MRICKAGQNSAQWLKDRAGIPTASNFNKIVTPKTLKLSASRVAYLNQLVGERFLGTCEELPATWAMERGSEMEEEARSAYRIITGESVEEVGLCLHDEWQVGASPDGLVGEHGGLELKCPNLATHVGYLLGGVFPDAYAHQVQGNLLVTGREWWDFMSYFPKLPPFIIRVQRDEAYIEALTQALPAFCKEVDEAEARLRAETS